MERSRGRSHAFCTDGAALQSARRHSAEDSRDAHAAAASRAL